MLLTWGGHARHATHSKDDHFFPLVFLLQIATDGQVAREVKGLP